MFRGICERSDNPPLSMFEMTLGDDQQYHYKTNTSIAKADIWQYEELSGNDVFKNYLFIKVSDIIAVKTKQEFDVEPYAVLCFYNNRVTSSANSSEIRNGGIKPNATKLDFEITQEHKRPYYERFDPKRIRQLLLLRNDLKEFIQHHFNNDSLRAYIEMLDKSNFYLTLKHGTNVYESIVARYIKEAQNCQSQEAVKTILPYLENSFGYLTNKLNLLSQAAKLFDSSNYEITIVQYTITEIAEIFSRNCEYVLMMEQSKWENITNSESIKFISVFEPQFENLKAGFLQSVLKDLVFELLYNVKKHCASINYSTINEANKLVITLSHYIKNDQHYLALTNNHSYMEKGFIAKKNEQLRNQRKTDGLNLLHSILLKLTNKHIFIEQENNHYTIHIPLKTNFI
jgi:hypothetical protein